MIVIGVLRLKIYWMPNLSRQRNGEYLGSSYRMSRDIVKIEGGKTDHSLYFISVKSRGRSMTA